MNKNLTNDLFKPKKEEKDDAQTKALDPTNQLKSEDEQNQEEPEKKEPEEPDLKKAISGA
jgi:hypothetical protein